MIQLYHTTAWTCCWRWAAKDEYVPNQVQPLVQSPARGERFGLRLCTAGTCQVWGCLPPRFQAFSDVIPSVGSSMPASVKGTTRSAMRRPAGTFWDAARTAIGSKARSFRSLRRRGSTLTTDCDRLHRTRRARGGADECSELESPERAESPRADAAEAADEEALRISAPVSA